MTGVAILGSTGSIGTQALDVIRSHRSEYEVVALAAGRNADLLAAQAAEFGVDPKWARTTGDDPDDDKLDFKDEDVRALMDVYIQAGQANGDLRGLARAIKSYGQITGHNLRDNAFDDLAAAAGNPPGAAELKDRLFQAGQSSWGPGCAVRQDDVQEVLDAAA